MLLWVRYRCRIHNLRVCWEIQINNEAGLRYQIRRSVNSSCSGLTGESKTLELVVHPRHLPRVLVLDNNLSVSLRVRSSSNRLTR